MPDLSDDELAALVTKKNQQAFRLLIERHATYLHRVAYRLLLTTEDAEDAVQDVFTRYWQKPENWNPDKANGAKFRTWLTQAVINSCRDRLRKAPSVSLDDIEEQAATDNTEKVVVLGQMRKQLAQGMAQLPERQREAVVLCLCEDYSMKDAADLMQTTPKAVESLLGRARTYLKNYFERKDGSHEI